MKTTCFIVLSLGLFLSPNMSAEEVLPLCDIDVEPGCAAKIERKKNAPPPLKHGWNVGCDVDRVTLERTCYTVKRLRRGNHIKVFHSKVLGYCFTGPINNHPGRNAVIRIGDGKPVQYKNTIACFATGRNIIDQMVSEQPGVVRGFRWPSETIEYEFETKGFTEAFAALKKRVSQYK